MNFGEKYRLETDNIHFSADFCEKTSVLLKEAAEEKEYGIMRINRKTLKIIAAAAALIIFSLTAGAVIRFVLPEDFGKFTGVDLENIAPVVDTETAGPDEVTVIRKTYSDDRFTVTFEATADGRTLDKLYDGNGSEQPIDQNGKYAIFTIRRNDGGQVLYAEDGKGLDSGALGYIILIEGYYTNPSMLADEEHYNLAYYDDTDVLYVVCDITNALMFADKELHIALTDKLAINYEVIEMSREGKFSYTEEYDGIRALYDFDLDDGLADPAAAREYMADRPFLTYDEFQEALAHDLAELAAEEEPATEDLFEPTTAG